MAHGSERLFDTLRAGGDSRCPRLDASRVFRNASDLSGQTAVSLTGGELAGFDDARKPFGNPEHRRVEDDVTGRFG